jgi:dipeptidase E
MRLYLSSFGIGHHPEALISLLRGGTRAAVILNAKDGSSPDGRRASLEREVASLSALRLRPEELDLRDFFGQPDALRETLRGFDLVWVRGGNTFVLRRAFHQSGMDGVLPELLREDALVYGGFSAAVAVLAPSLKGIDLVDDPSLVPDGYAPPVVWDGLGLIPYAVAPHYRSDHPESESVERLVQYFIDHHLLFRALRDGEAIVVNGVEEHVLR